jgi:YHS domain-containing protein
MMNKLLMSGFLTLACTGALVLAHDKPATRPSKDDVCITCKAKATTQPTAQAKPINKMCPVETDDEVDPAVTVVYEGKTIGFCCTDCVKEFKKDPAKYLANLK